MIRGFSGVSLEQFLRNTNDGMQRASKGHSRNPFEGVSAGLVQLPLLGAPANKRPPFPEESAFGGGHDVGVGNQTNIVVDQGVYDTAIRMVDMADEQAGEDLYRIITAIEEMCTSIYVVPETVPKVLSITGQIKDSLGQFRSITENVNIQTRRFVNEIREIDRARGSFSFVLNDRIAADTISTVSNAMKQQNNNMQDTIEDYRMQIQLLHDQIQEFEEEISDREARRRELQAAIRSMQMASVDNTSDPWSQPDSVFFRR